MAVSVTLKAAPAVCSTGVVTVNFLVVAAALTVNEPEVPSIVPSFALSVVLWASYSLSAEAVPTPSVKVTAVAVVGYSGAVALGELEGPLHAIVFAPV